MRSGTCCPTGDQMREGGRGGMRYRSAAFARLSAHAPAGVGSTHFPARCSSCTSTATSRPRKTAPTSAAPRSSNQSVTASWMLSSSREDPAAAAAPTQQRRRPKVRMMPVCDSAWTGAAPARRARRAAPREAAGRYELVLANARAHPARVAACAAGYVARREQRSHKNFVSLVIGLGAKPWRRKCCRTGRHSP